MKVRIKATLDFLFKLTIIAIFSNLCAYFYRQIQLFLGLLYYIDTFIPKYLSARVCYIFKFYQVLLHKNGSILHT